MLKCMQASRTRVSGLSWLPSFTSLSCTNQVVLNASSSLKLAGKCTTHKALASAGAGYVAGTLLAAAVADLLQ